MTITAAVDGSALGNPGPAGWAWVVSEDCWDAGGWDHGTNNLGELTAVLELLRATREAGLADEPLHILADSQYAINVVTKWRHGWKKRGWAKADKKPIANLDVIRAIDEAMAGRSVTFEWVRGHAGHALNERADDRARAAAEAHQSGSPVPTGPGFARTAGTSDAPGTPDQVATVSTATGPGGHGTSTVRVMDAEKSFVRAWATGDGRALEALSARDVRRVWPDGSRSDGLAGPVPEGLRVSRLEVRDLGGEAWLVTYALSWEGGSSREASLWERVEPGGTTQTDPGTTPGNAGATPGNAGATPGDQEPALRMVWHQSTARHASS